MNSHLHRVPSEWNRLMHALLGNTAVPCEATDPHDFETYHNTKTRQTRGQITITVSNVTRARSKAATIIQHAQHGLHILTETNADESVQYRVNEETRAHTATMTNDAPTTFCWGHTTADFEHNAGIALVAGPMFHRSVSRLTPTTQQQVSAQQSGRLEAYKVATKTTPRHGTDAGITWLYIIVLYGSAHSTRDAEDVIQAADAWVRQLGGEYPVLVCGDFNMEWQDSDTMMSWKSTDDMTDLHEALALSRGSIPENTTDKRRIDMIWGNTPMRRATVDVQTTKIYATHRSLQLTINLCAFTQQRRYRQTPHSLHTTTPRDVTTYDTWECLNYDDERWCQLWTQTQTDSTTQERQATLDDLFELWSARAERYLALQTRKTWHKCQHQRGRLQPLRTRTTTPQVTRHDWRHDHYPRLHILQTRASHALRRLDALARMQYFGPQALHTWTHARHDLIWLTRHATTRPPFFTHHMPTNSEITKYSVWAQQLRTDSTTAYQRLHARERRQELRVKPHKYITEKFRKAAHFVSGTCDVREIDHLARSFWTGVWRDSDGNNDEQKRLVDSLPLPHHSATLEPLTAEHLRHCLDRPGGAPGPCGWRHQELHALPDELLDQVCSIFAHLESIGMAPTFAKHGDITLIPKKETSVNVDDLRPITVLSTLYRLWAGARLHADIFGWQEEIVKDFAIVACRRKHSVFDLVFSAALHLDVSRATSQPAFGVSYDLAKAFDTMPFGKQGLGWHILRRLGFPSKIMAVMQDMYEHISRRFKTAGHLGEPIPARGMRGLVQGCALSMVLCNCMTVVWFAMQKHGCALTPNMLSFLRRHPHWPQHHDTHSTTTTIQRPDHTLHNGGYADDLHTITTTPQRLTRSHTITVIWTIIFDMSLNPVKSIAFGKAALYVGDRQLPQQTTFQLLGHLLDARGQLPTPSADRLHTVNRRLRRLAQIPGNQHRRQMLITTTILSVLYGVETVQYDFRSLSILRRDVWQAIRAGRPPFKVAAIEVLCTVCAPGHLVDPVQYLVYTLVRNWARWLQAAGGHALTQRAWSHTTARDTTALRAGGGCLVRVPSDSSYKSEGVTANFHDILLSFNWRWTTATQIDTTTTTYNFPLDND